MTTALRHSTPCLANLAGAYLWIVDQHMRLIDHTPDVSHALGLNRDEMTRRPGDNLNPVNDDNPAHRALRALQRERILAVIDSGQPSTQLHWEYLPAAGGMRHLIITIVKYSPTQALLIAHDLTEAAGHILDWLRAPAIQAIPALVYSDTGRVQACTDAMALLLGFADAGDAIGQNLSATAFGADAARGIELAKAAGGMPVTRRELGVDLKGQLIDYAISRALLPDGHIFTLLQVITGQTAVVLPEAANYTAVLNGKPLTNKQIAVLLALWAAEPRDATAILLGITTATVDFHRGELKRIAGIEPGRASTRQLLEVVRASPLGELLDRLVVLRQEFDGRVQNAAREQRGNGSA